MSHLNKKKLTKKIYYNDGWWELVKVISPTKYDDYLLLQRDGDEYDEDKSGKTYTTKDMALIDAGNETFFTDTKKIRKRLKDIQKLQDEIYKLKGKGFLIPHENIPYGKEDRLLDDNWLNCFHDH